MARQLPIRRQWPTTSAVRNAEPAAPPDRPLPASAVNFDDEPSRRSAVCGLRRSPRRTTMSALRVRTLQLYLAVGTASRGTRASASQHLPRGGDISTVDRTTGGTAAIAHDERGHQWHVRARRRGTPRLVVEEFWSGACSAATARVRVIDGSSSESSHGNAGRFRIVIELAPTGAAFTGARWTDVTPDAPVLMPLIQVT